MKTTKNNHGLLKNIQFGCTLFFCCFLLWSCGSRKTPAPVFEIYQGKTYKDFERQAYEGESYRVQTGDTLFSIAWYSGNDYQDLAKINGIKEPYNIYPGQTLILQKTAPPLSLKSNTKAIDPPKKQAYGKSELNVNKDSIESSVGKFPTQIKHWSWPTKRIISRHFSEKDEGNKGLDFNGKKGEPIWAAADGKVVYTGDALRGFGKLVIIKHSEAYLTAYAHNDTILVKEQQWIKSGDKIATMGMSGTDKVKLHFEVRYKGKSVNPLRYLPKR